MAHRQAQNEKKPTIAGFGFSTKTADHNQDPESVTPSVDAECRSLISICFSKIAGAPVGSPQFLGSK
jgi:hypothetical protein